MKHIIKLFLAVSILALYLTLHISLNDQNMPKTSMDGITHVVVGGLFLWSSVFCLYFLYLIVQKTLNAAAIKMMRYKIIFYFITLLTYIAVPIPFGIVDAGAKYTIRILTGVKNSSNIDFKNPIELFLTLFTRFFIDGIFRMIFSAILIISLYFAITYLVKLFNRNKILVRPDKV